MAARRNRTLENKSERKGCLETHLNIVAHFIPISITWIDNFKVWCWNGREICLDRSDFSTICAYSVRVYKINNEFQKLPEVRKYGGVPDPV